MDEWIAFVREAQDLPWVRAIVVVGVSVLVAKIVDLLISRFLLRLTLRTNTDLDDHQRGPQSAGRGLAFVAKSAKKDH